MKEIILSPISIEELESRLDSKIRRSLLEILKDAQSNPGKPQSEDILTFKEGCKFLNIAEPTGYAKVSKREIPFIKKGKFIYFSKLQLTEWLLSGQQKTIAQLEAEAAKRPIRNKRYPISCYE